MKDIIKNTCLVFSPTKHAKSKWRSSCAWWFFFCWTPPRALAYHVRLVFEVFDTCTHRTIKYRLSERSRNMSTEYTLSTPHTRCSVSSGEKPQCHTRPIPRLESNPGEWPPRWEGAPLRYERVGCMMNLTWKYCIYHSMLIERSQLHHFIWNLRAHSNTRACVLYSRLKLVQSTVIIAPS